MGLIRRLRSKFASEDRYDEREDWPSIVFLLREPHLPSPEDALKMGRDAWGAAGPVELAGTVPPHSYLLRADPLFFALHFAHARYEVESLHLLPIQKASWDKHAAWLSVDLPSKRAEELRAQGRLAVAYKTLMYFVYKYWSPNVLALYFPADGAVLPNFGDFVASIRESRKNGIDLDFLKAPKGS